MTTRRPADKVRKSGTGGLAGFKARRAEPAPAARGQERSSAPQGRSAPGAGASRPERAAPRPDSGSSRSSGPGRDGQRHPAGTQKFDKTANDRRPDQRSGTPGDAWQKPRADEGARVAQGRSASPRDGGKGVAPQQARPRVPAAAYRIDQVESALGGILTWEYPADAALSHWLRNHPKLGSRDRAEVSEAVFDVLRHLRRYRQYAETGRGRAGRRLAILGLSATRGRELLAPVLAPDEAEWLERVEAIDLSTLPRDVRASIPAWLDERLARLPEVESLLQSLNQSADLDLRVNPMKADRDEMLAALRKGLAPHHDPRPTPYSPWGIRLSGRPTLTRWPQFEHGLIEVQDEGSQLLAALVAPKRGEMIIDFCAGAGGKTLLLGALMRSTGRLYAFDVSAARLTRAKPRLARSGLSNVVPVVIDNENDTRVKRLAGKAQRVLVDAPCSGMGTLRRNPDLKWRQSVQSLYELCDLQRRILDSASRCVAPGGRLVYATCSLLEEENEEQVRGFLARNPAFRQVDARDILAARCEGLQLDGPVLKLRPDVHGTDGFFAAVFERVKAGADVAPANLQAESATAADVLDGEGGLAAADD